MTTATAGGTGAGTGLRGIERPRLDVEAEIEKRKANNNQIFTSITNETRYESLSMIRKYKQEMKPPAGIIMTAIPPPPGGAGAGGGEGGIAGVGGGGGLGGVQGTSSSSSAMTITEISARYLQQLQHGNEIFKEIENIINKALPSSKYPLKELKQSRSVPNGVQRKIKTLKKSPSTSLAISRTRTNLKLAPLEERYGNITESWQKGPIDIPKDRYYDLNDESIFGNSHDPRARQLKQQTKCLMNSLTTMSKQARVNATCRRRVVENSQEIGEDHVVESLDRFLPGDLSHPGQGRAIYEAALEQVTYRKRKTRRRVNGRIDEVWEILAAPTGSKLSFKLHSETMSPHILSDRLATQRETSSHEDSSLPSSVSMIVSLEKLVDCLHIIDLLHLLLKKWADDESLPRVFSSNDLIQPLSTLLRAVGITKGTKKAGDDICEWIVSMLEKLHPLSCQIIQDIRTLAIDLEDGNFDKFLTSLGQKIEAMIKISTIFSPGKPVAFNEDIPPTIGSGLNDEGLEDYWRRHEGDLEVYQLQNSQISQSIGGGEVLAMESTLTSHPSHPPHGRQRGGKLFSSDALEDDEPPSHVEVRELPKEDPSPLPTLQPPPNVRNLRSYKIRQSLVPITEVVNISELEKYHHQKPNYELLSRVTKRLEESVKERSDQHHVTPSPLDVE